MSRKLFIAGNWKMNTTLQKAIDLAGGLEETIGSIDEIDLGVFPPSVYLKAVCDRLADSEIAVGAQNMHYEDSGAFTGEISAPMIRDCGSNLVLLGHSERRHKFGETDEMINMKVRKALEAGMQVVLAIGELLDEREAGKTIEVNSRQVKAGLKDVSPEEMERVVLAYEPVWAIGTGKTATPEQAQEVHAGIRDLLASIYGNRTAAATRIQYGGSMKPDNSGELLAMEDIDGGLVGGASLKVDSFTEIVKSGLGK